MWRQGRADPVRSAASLVDIKRRDEEKGDFKQRSQRSNGLGEESVESQT